MGGVILVKIPLDLYYKIMIIKRKLFNISDREELERLKSIKPTLGKKLAATGALGGTGALLGLAGGRGGALLGGTIGAATGAYVTSNYFRKKQINKLQKRSASNNAIKLLKDVGVKGKELKRAEKELNESLKTYKLSRSKKVLEALNRGLDDLTPSEKERLKINRENKIENLKRSIKSVFKKK